MSLNDNINEIVKLAKESNGKIELYVKTDICDADYSIRIFQFSVDDFIKYEIGDIYKFLRTMADDWQAVSNSSGNTRYKVEEAHRKTIENRWNGKDAIDDRYKDVYVDGFGEYLAYGIGPYKPHTIVDTKLKVVIKEI